MADVPDPDRMAAAAEELLKARVGAVRELAALRARTMRGRKEQEQREREDQAGYELAVRAGWTEEELKRLGLEPVTTPPRSRGRGSQRRSGARASRPTARTPSADA